MTSKQDGRSGGTAASQPLQAHSIKWGNSEPLQTGPEPEALPHLSPGQTTPSAPLDPPAVKPERPPFTFSQEQRIKEIAREVATEIMKEKQ